MIPLMPEMSYYRTPNSPFPLTERRVSEVAHLQATRNETKTLRWIFSLSLLHGIRVALDEGGDNCLKLQVTVGPNHKRHALPLGLLVYYELFGSQLPDFKGCEEPQKDASSSGSLCDPKR